LSYVAYRSSVFLSSIQGGTLGQRMVLGGLKSLSLFSSFTQMVCGETSQLHSNSLETPTTSKYISWRCFVWSSSRRGDLAHARVFQNPEGLWRPGVGFVALARIRISLCFSDCHPTYRFAPISSSPAVCVFRDFIAEGAGPSRNLIVANFGRAGSVRSMGPSCRPIRSQNHLVFLIV